MRKAMNKYGGKILRSGLSGLLAVVPMFHNEARAEEVVRFEAVPESIEGASPVTKWVRGGRGWIFAYGWNESSKTIDAADWRLNVPSQLEGYLNCIAWERPWEEADIFDGVPLDLDIYAYPGYTSNVCVEQGGSGVSSGESGAWEVFGFDIADNALLGVFDFTINDKDAREPNGTPVTCVNGNDYSFKIMPDYGDMNGDGLKNLADVEIFANKLVGTDNSLAPGELYSGEYGDWAGNNDGVFDARDIQPFVENILPIHP